MTAILPDVVDTRCGDVGEGLYYGLHGEALMSVKPEKVTIDELLGPLNSVERKHAPAALFVSGDKGLCRDFARVSVIGTREPSSEGIKRTQAVVRMLTEKRVVVVSGLARGVDACAHLTAIECGGRTIAVLGTPLDIAYPKENGELQRLIMTKHLAVSQFPSGYAVQPKNFAIRNRTMALLSHATVIIEAGESSGTLHQGWEALRLGRPLFLMESLTKRKDLKWPGEML
ncbi:MAG TPA: DNA-processing protein DprA, partial [Elusimicrobiota bacterium]|nr:DNA-processing protein DprA [Elusimicrobiota bacterium]